jgi:hypothetical protein
MEVSVMVYFLVFALFNHIYEDNDSLIVIDDSLIICGYHQYAVKVHISTKGRLDVRPWDYADSTGWLLLESPLITIEDSSSIIGLGSGYWGGRTGHANGLGPGYGSAGAMGGGGGAGYGGAGGQGGDTNPGLGGSPYGDSADTLIDMGSGGGAGYLSAADGWGGNGGAKVYLRGGGVFIDSSYIQTNGGNGAEGGFEAGGGGSGGGVMILADSIFISYAEFNANGGSGGDAPGGGGGGAGGGRIKMFYVSRLDTSHLGLSVEPGPAGSGMYGSPEPGMPGSIYIAPITGIEERVQEPPKQHNVSTYLVRNGIELTVTHAPITLMMYDASGRVVKTFMLTNDTGFIDLCDLSQGVYFLKSTDNRTFGKIILLK